MYTYYTDSNKSTVKYYKGIMVIVLGIVMFIVSFFILRNLEKVLLGVLGCTASVIIIVIGIFEFIDKTRQNEQFREFVTDEDDNLYIIWDIRNQKSKNGQTLKKDNSLINNHRDSIKKEKIIKVEILKERRKKIKVILTNKFGIDKKLIVCDNYIHYVKFVTELKKIAQQKIINIEEMLEPNDKFYMLYSRKQAKSIYKIYKLINLLALVVPAIALYLVDKFDNRKFWEPAPWYKGWITVISIIVIVFGLIVIPVLYLNKIFKSNYSKLFIQDNCLFYYIERLVDSESEPTYYIDRCYHIEKIDSFKEYKNKTVITGEIRYTTKKYNSNSKDKKIHSVHKLNKIQIPKIFNHRDIFIDFLERKLRSNTTDIKSNDLN